jgi:hypothetical protein
MDFVNETKVQAGWTLGFERDGRELLVVAVKATYEVPATAEEPMLAEKQTKLVLADEFTGEPGCSAPLRETDYSPRKLNCDVVLNGTAYAPGGRPTTAVEVSLRVGSMRKSFFVFGDRRWQDFILPPSGPEPFSQMPISYDRAYGGADCNENEPDRVATYAENPVGTGYHPIRRGSALVGRLLPNTAEGRTPISDTKGRHRPMSFGPVGRNFFPRYKHAGTYDQSWLDNEAPFWPADFSYAYFQSAPDDQQVPYLQGSEEVELKNLTPDGTRSFRLPHRCIPVTCIPRRGDDLQTEMVCDTLLFEPDLGHFSMTWRAAIPLRRNLFELKQMVVGDMPYAWYSKRRAERAGKAYYASLAEAVAARRATRRVR